MVQIVFPVRKRIVLISLLYIVAAGAMLGLLSDWFREDLVLAGPMIKISLVASLPLILTVAAIAFWRHYDHRLTLLLIAIVLGAVGYVVWTHHEAFGTWVPPLPIVEVETSGTAVLNAHGETIRYRLELHDAGTVWHREYLIMRRGGNDTRIRLPVFGDERSGHVSAQTPNDWIVLHPTADPNVYRAETGRLLLVQKSFRVDLRTAEVTRLAAKPAG